jgi:hypothetical protein
VQLLTASGLQRRSFFAPNTVQQPCFALGNI